MKNQINISNLTPEQIEDLKQQLKAFDGQPKTIMDKVKSWEDAITLLESGCWICSESLILHCFPDANSSHKNTVPSEKHAKSILATSQLMVIAEALNEGWKPNWNNNDQMKYVIYRYGNIFNLEGCCKIYRLPIVFKSKEIAEYAMTQFEDLWYDYFMIDKPKQI